MTICMLCGQELTANETPHEHRTLGPCREVQAERYADALIEIAVAERPAREQLDRQRRHRDRPDRRSPPGVLAGGPSAGHRLMARNEHRNLGMGDRFRPEIMAELAVKMQRATEEYAAAERAKLAARARRRRPFLGGWAGEYGRVGERGPGASLLRRAG